MQEEEANHSPTGDRKADDARAARLLKQDSWSSEMRAPATRASNERKKNARRRYELEATRALAQLEMAAEKAAAALEVDELVGAQFELAEHAKLSYPMLMLLKRSGFLTGYAAARGDATGA